MTMQYTNETMWRPFGHSVQCVSHEFMQCNDQTIQQGNLVETIRPLDATNFASRMQHKYQASNSRSKHYANPTPTKCNVFRMRFTLLQCNDKAIHQGNMVQTIRPPSATCFANNCEGSGTTAGPWLLTAVAAIPQVAPPPPHPRALIGISPTGGSFTRPPLGGPGQGPSERFPLPLVRHLPPPAVVATGAPLCMRPGMMRGWLGGGNWPLPTTWPARRERWRGNMAWATCFGPSQP